MIVKKTPQEIEKMRAAGAVVARCLKELAESIVPGETTTLDVTRSEVWRGGVVQELPRLPEHGVRRGERRSGARHSGAEGPAGR